jgi:hypothetical protein
MKEIKKLTAGLKNLLSRKSELESEAAPLSVEARARQILEAGTCTTAEAVSQARLDHDDTIGTRLEIETLESQILKVAESLGQALDQHRQMLSARATRINAESLLKWVNKDGLAIVDERARRATYILSNAADPAIEAASKAASVPQLTISSKGFIDWRTGRSVRPSYRDQFSTSGGAYDHPVNIGSESGSDLDRLLEIISEL